MAFSKKPPGQFPSVGGRLSEPCYFFFAPPPSGPGSMGSIGSRGIIVSRLWMDGMLAIVAIGAMLSTVETEIGRMLSTVRIGEIGVIGVITLMGLITVIGSIGDIGGIGEIPIRAPGSFGSGPLS